MSCPDSPRLSAKAFLLDAAGRVLLLDCTDPGDPGTTWWELPGGGVEAEEDEIDAVVREVAEETGLTVDAADVGPLLWTQDSTYTWLGVRRWARCHGRVVAAHGAAGVAAGAAVAAPLALTDDEHGTILGSRWWTVEQVIAHEGRFFPSTLPSLLPRVLAGERVDEPFDRWN